MAITFNTKYPAALKNSAWQKKKSFKDKSKSITKTGLGDALAKAEKDWGAIKFDKLIAAKQALGDKNVAERLKAKQAAQTYLTSDTVHKAITSLQAAASRARVTGTNTALSNTALTAAKALSGPLLAQAKLLEDIKLDDFNPPTQVRLDIGHQEEQHTQALRAMDSKMDELKSMKNRENWEAQDIGEHLEKTVKLTHELAEVTGDEHWTDMNNRWRRLLVAYTRTNQLVKNQPEDRVAEEIQEYVDLVQKTLGGVFQ